MKLWFVCHYQIELNRADYISCLSLIKWIYIYHEISLCLVKFSKTGVFTALSTSSVGRLLVLSLLYGWVGESEVILHWRLKIVVPLESLESVVIFCAVLSFWTCHLVMISWRCFVWKLLKEWCDIGGYFF